MIFLCLPVGYNKKYITFVPNDTDVRNTLKKEVMKAKNKKKSSRKEELVLINNVTPSLSRYDKSTLLFNAVRTMINNGVKFQYLTFE